MPYSPKERTFGWPVLVHFHIFKNGGSTLDWILRRNFGDDFAVFHGEAPTSVLRSDDLRHFLLQHPTVKAISSHHLRLPLDTDFDRPVLPLFILRHPIDRIASIFEQDRRQRGRDQSEPKFGSLKQWVAHTLRVAPHLICDSQTVLFAAGGAYYDPPTTVELRIAIDVIRRLSFCGIVDDFDRSMVLLESIVKPSIAMFDAAYFPQNVSEGRGSMLEERLNIIRNELGEELNDHVIINNQYDLKLLEFARMKLRDELARLSDIDLRVNDLLKRNVRLR